jgi:hypothetical protein
VVDLDRTLDEEVRDVVPGSEVYISFRFERSNKSVTSFDLL